MKLAFGVALLSICIGLYFVYHRNFSSSSPSSSSPSSSVPTKLFTKEELARHGKDAASIYLSIVGEVFDVTKGAKHYGPRGGYSFFSGRDASRAFITGNFSHHLDDDVEDFSDDQLSSLLSWVRTYHRDYIYLGVLIGRFYSPDGQPTPFLLSMRSRAAAYEAAKRSLDALFPKCNSKWEQGKGGMVWCSINSGGIEREWAGYPRQLYSASTKSTTCVCVKDAEPQPNAELYPNCPPTSSYCAVPDT